MKIKQPIFISCFFAIILLNGFVFAQELSDEYVRKAWFASGQRNFNEVYKATDECITRFAEEAHGLAKTLSDFPSKEKINEYQIMNDVATCYFIKGEALFKENKLDESVKILTEVIEKFPYAQAFDPRGWYWSIKDKAEKTLLKMAGPSVTKKEESIIITKLKLVDSGKEFPVNYRRYGVFQHVGTPQYKFVVRDLNGLTNAVGEGIYPNTNLIKADPEYEKIKNKLPSIDHWQILNSRDLSAAFYKWNTAPEPEGVKQFYLADILERAGYLKSAINAYYAVVVHFPQIYGWTYWHTPWYPAQAALYRIKHLLRENPHLNLSLEGAFIKIRNGFDNDVKNDIFIVNPGKFIKKSSEYQKSTLDYCDGLKRKNGKVIQTRGSEKIKLVKYESGDWQLLVDEKPFMIKGLTYTPTPVGESPDEGTLESWTKQDINKNGIIDSPYESWIDKNFNNFQDKTELKIGDFKLMKEMGVNCLRLYHQPFALNKDLLRQMYQEYGIYVMLGDFLGKYVLGSNATWEEGTDYDNPVHKKNMLESVKKMVLEYKDEPYILIWLIGNENVYGLGCNADKKPESFFKFVNEAALLIKSLDPYKRPVAVASGDTIYLDVFAKNCPDVDIFGTNSYRGKYGFLELWDSVKECADKPVMITEYGVPSYGYGYSREEAEKYQSNYHKAAWIDIFCNSCGYGAGNALGSFIFEWIDEWWKAYEPYYHDTAKLSAGPFLDGHYYEEWFGLCSQGDGKNSPFLRQLKKVYYTYKQLWNENPK